MIQSERRALGVFAVVSICAMLAGCVTGRPRWVDNPGSAYPRGRAVCSVGVSAHVPNVGMARRRAAHAARVEMANSMKVEVSAMMKDWMASLASSV